MTTCNSSWTLRASAAVLGWGMLLSIVAGTGCGPSAPKLSLDKDLARRSLSTFLESWKSGEKAESLKGKSPSIIGRDPEWDAGRKLSEFKLGEETDDGANLHVQVTLTYSDATTSPATEQIRYAVGTSPVITIQRAE